MARTTRASGDDTVARLAEVLAHSPDAMAISRAVDGTILDANAQFERLSGYARDAIIGRTTAELGLWVRPADRETFLAAVARGESGAAQAFPLRDQSGNERWGVMSARPVMRAGEACLLVAVRDVTEQHRAEAALRESEARYRALVEDQTEFIVRWLPDGTRTFVNEAYCRYFGGRPEDHIGSSFLPLVAPEDREQIRAKIARLTVDHPVETAQHRVIRGDGTLGWNEWTDRALFDADGRLVELLSVGRDITAAHAAQEELRQSEVRIRTLADAAFEGLALTRDGVIQDCNARLADMLGSSRHRLIGRSVSEFVAPEDRDTVADHIAHEAVVPYEHSARREDGTTFPVEVQGRSVPGSPGTRITAIRDITGRREAENARRRTEARYRALIEHAPYGIYQSNAEGKFLMANPALAAMLGYPSVDALLAVDLARDVYADPGQRAGLLREFAGIEHIEGAIATWRRRDGSPITVRLSGRQVQAPDGSLECFEMLVEDVTTQHELEAQLRQAQKMEAIGQLTTGIAHDFNNMLAVILANAQLLADAPAEEVTTGLKEIEQAAAQGTAIVRQLLGFARRADLAIAPAHLGTAVEHIEPMLRRLMPKNIDVRVEVPADLATIYADTPAVEQILLNLVTNARDAMPDGGTLAITAANARLGEAHRRRHPWIVPGNYVCLTVADTGAGMDAHVQQHIFEPFFTTKPPGVGTGLGLSMVYGLMKQHDGLVQIDSAPGKGTVVNLHFRQAAADAPDRLPATAPEVPATGTETILLVDDEDGLRRTGRRALERFGYTVLTARDGVEALEVFERYRSTIDLVLSDLAMPRLDGWGLYRQLRAEGHEVRFVLASGHREADTLERMAITTEVAYLQKPWTLDDLSRCVRKVLDELPAG